MRKIWVTGMKHSGSTMCFHMIMELCKAHGYHVNNAYIMDKDTYDKPVVKKRQKNEEKISNDEGDDEKSVVTNDGEDDEGYYHGGGDEDNGYDEGNDEKNDGTMLTNMNDVHREKKEAIKVFKMHHPHKLIKKSNDLVILTIRDIRDTSISHFFRFFLDKEHEDANEAALLYGLNPFLKGMHENINIYMKLLPFADLIFHYEEYKMDPHRYIAILSQCVFPSHPPLPAEKIQDIIDVVEAIPKNEKLLENLVDYHRQWKILKDQPPLLLRDHNTSNGKSKKYSTFFSQRQNEIIIENPKIKCWLQANGYIE